MVTNEQLLHGLAALLGQIIGRVPSPEFFVPVALVAYYAQTFRHIFLYSLVCALVGTITFLLFIGKIEYAVTDFIIRYIGSVLFIGIVFILRRAFRKKKDSNNNVGGVRKPLLSRLRNLLRRKAD